MATEIERKFLIKHAGWRVHADSGTAFRQGYLCREVGRTVRVRLAGTQAYLTIKGETIGLARAEYEYAIPAADAIYMLDQLCERPLIEKTRYLVPYAGLTWEVDVFEGDNAGLIIAEIELVLAEQTVALPDWIGQEVSDDPRYYNANLVEQPFSRWGAAWANSPPP